MQAREAMNLISLLKNTMVSIHSEMNANLTVLSSAAELQAARSRSASMRRSSDKDAGAKDVSLTGHKPSFAHRDPVPRCIKVGHHLATQVDATDRWRAFITVLAKLPNDELYPSHVIGLLEKSLLMTSAYNRDMYGIESLQTTLMHMLNRCRAGMTWAEKHPKASHDQVKALFVECRAVAAQLIV